MKFASTLIVAALALVAQALPGAELQKRAISQELYDTFLRMATISRAAYEDNCRAPGGLPLLLTIRDRATDADGYIVQDAARKQIIVAMRGTSGIGDVRVDLDNKLIPFTAIGSTGCSGCTVHQGFHKQWAAVGRTVMDTVAKFLQANPDYTIITTGHSLGGALTVLTGIALEKAYPGKVISYGFASPRVGNPAFAKFVNEAFGERMHRITHTADNVPQDLTQAEGYEHVAIEYWISRDPASPSTIVKCNGGEDRNCNISVAKANSGLAGINADHFTYMNINFSSARPVCSASRFF